MRAGGGKESVFFKCPIGGFASLRPGRCPKCLAPLTPVAGDAMRGESQNAMRLSIMNHMVRVRSGIARTRALLLVVATVAALLLPGAAASAHEGEDHSQDKAPIVSATADMIVRVTRLGESEVMIKHRPVEPDRETTARLFLTRFASNEPIEGARVVVHLSGGATGASQHEATASTSATTPGLYELKFPPLPEGDYRLTAIIELGGVEQKVDYGALQVAPRPALAVDDGVSAWSPTLLILLGAGAGIGFIGVVIYRAMLAARRDRVKGEAATA